MKKVIISIIEHMGFLPCTPFMLILFAAAWQYLALLSYTDMMRLQ